MIARLILSGTFCLGTLIGIAIIIGANSSGKWGWLFLGIPIVIICGFLLIIAELTYQSAKRSRLDKEKGHGEPKGLQNHMKEVLIGKYVKRTLPPFMKPAKKYICLGQYRKAIEFLTNNTDENSPDLGERMMIKAQLCIAEGCFEEAEVYCKKSINILPTYENLMTAGELYTELKRPLEAVGYYKHCLRMELSSKQEIIVFNSFTRLLGSIKDHRVARKTFAEIVDIYDKLAAKYPDILDKSQGMFFNHQGFLHQTNKEYSKAKEFYKEAIDAERKIIAKDPNHNKQPLAELLMLIGMSYSSTGERTIALECLRESLEIYRGLAAKDPATYNSNVAAVLNNMGVELCYLKQYDEAEQCYLEEMQIQDALVRANNNDNKATQSKSLVNLAKLYALQKKYEKAEECYNKGLAIYESIVGKDIFVDNIDLANYLTTLAIFYLKEYPNESLSMRHAKESIKILRTCDNTELVKTTRAAAEKVIRQWKIRR